MPSAELSPEQVYERRWAHAMIERATERLAQKERLAGRAAEFEQLRPHVVGSTVARPYSELAAQLGIKESALKVRVHRLRKRLGTYLREDLQLTVPDAAGVEGELEHLRGLVAG